MLALLAPILSLVLGKVFDSFDLGQKLKLTKEQFIEQTNQHLADAQAEIEKAFYSMLETYTKEAQATIRASFTAPGWFTRNAWAFVVLSQTFVLLWYQIGIPWYVQLTGLPMARTGDQLLQWAYLLVGGALGVGALQQGRQSVDLTKYIKRG